MIETNESSGTKETSSQTLKSEKESLDFELQIQINEKSDNDKSKLIEKAKTCIYRLEGATKYRCSHPGCNKSFQYNSYLTAHLRVHLGYKIFKCSFKGCNRGFNYVWNLKSHEMTHSGLRHYKCYIDECQKSYIHSYDLRNHLKTHNPERSGFYCEFCPDQFSRYTTVMIHRKGHTQKNREKRRTEESNSIFLVEKVNTNTVIPTVAKHQTRQQSNKPYVETDFNLLPAIISALKCGTEKAEIEVQDRKIADQLITLWNQSNSCSSELQCNIDNLFTIRSNSYQSYCDLIDQLINTIMKNN